MRYVFALLRSLFPGRALRCRCGAPALATDASGAYCAACAVARYQRGA